MNDNFKMHVWLVASEIKTKYFAVAMCFKIQPRRTSIANDQYRKLPITYTSCTQPKNLGFGLTLYIRDGREGCYVFMFCLIMTDFFSN